MERVDVENGTLKIPEYLTKKMAEKDFVELHYLHGKPLMFEWGEFQHLPWSFSIDLKYIVLHSSMKERWNVHKKDERRNTVQSS